MSRFFKIEKRPYDNIIYKKSNIEINPGVTILTGCNGCGKTTLLHQIKDQLNKNNIPVVSFDNLHDGGSKAISSASFYGDFQFIANAMASSEGENIVMNIAKLASSLRTFIQTGEVQTERERFSNAFAKAIWRDNEEEKEKETPNERWLLLDAIDSGLSVDNIVDIKEYLFKTILKDNPLCSIYIIVSANEYELAREENCFDVYSGEYIEFKGYEDYRNYILKSRKQKDKRFK